MMIPESIKYFVFLIIIIIVVVTDRQKIKYKHHKKYIKLAEIFCSECLGNYIVL